MAAVAPSGQLTTPTPHGVTQRGYWYPRLRCHRTPLSARYRLCLRSLRARLESKTPSSLRWQIEDLPHLGHPLERTSSVLWASPTPDVARPVPRGRPVRGHAPPPPQAAPVAWMSLLHACRRHYPGGTAGCLRSSSPAAEAFLKFSQVGFRVIPFSGPAQRSLTLRPAHSLSRLMRPSTPKASVVSSPPRPLRLLPAGAKPAG